MIDMYLIHFEQLADVLGTVSFQRNLFAKCDAHLDGLRIECREAAEKALDGLKQRYIDSASVIALTILEFCGNKNVERLFESLRQCDLEWCDGVRHGMRLAPIGGALERLIDISQSEEEILGGVGADVLAFHRAMPTSTVHELAWCECAKVREWVAEAAGRSSNVPYESTIGRLLFDADARVRVAALRAAARRGIWNIADHAREQATAREPCIEAIRFLRIVGRAEDQRILTRLVDHDTLGPVAIEALGGIGNSDSVPFLLECLERPGLGDSAAHAMMRITGFSTPRSAPLEPPPDAAEEHLDFWSHLGAPSSSSATEWWTQNRRYFASSARYQFGVPAPISLLETSFDDWPDDVRYDEYLRRRTYEHDTTPDWELETWPQYQRNPGWASNSPVAK